MCGVSLRLLVVTAMCLCFTLLSPASGDPEVIRFGPNSQGKYKFCGKKLSQALHDVCQGRYNGLFKKSAEDSHGEDSSANGPPSMEELPYPYVPRVNAGSLIPVRRRTRGVHDECCKKSCTYHEIRSYCAH